MPYVCGPQGKIYYEVKGESQPSTHKDTLIMLRGLGRSSRYWLGYDDYLAKSYRVVTIDHRGVGGTTIPLGWTTKVEDMAEDVCIVMDELHIDQAHIFGLSFGGMVALALAAEQPERCQTLMVANTSTADTRALRVQPTAIPKIAKAVLKGRTHEVIMELVTCPRVDKRIGYQILAHWSKIMEDEGFPLETIAKQLLAASRFKIKNRVNTEQVPTLIIYGNQDQFVPVTNSKKLHQLIVGSQLRVLRGVGHEITIGHESLLKSFIDEFTYCKLEQQQKKVS